MTPRRRIVLQNKWSNHTGLAGANLGLANSITMFRCDLREHRRPYRGWRKSIGWFLRMLVTGWFGRRHLWACRLRIKEGR